MGRESSIGVRCGAGHRHSSDPTMLWLWCRPAAVALIPPLAWKLSYSAGTALKTEKKKKVLALLAIKSRKDNGRLNQESNAFILNSKGHQF